MKKFQQIMKPILLTAVGMNISLFVLALSLEQVADANVHLLALTSGSLCLLGYFSIGSDEDERS